MKIVGIIVEYNPFHNGHKYHIDCVKKMFPNSIIIAVMSGNVVQRGQFSLLSKSDKTKLALSYGVDIVLDLPFVFANQAANIFASKSLEILNHFKISDLVFGSETCDVDLYKELAKVQLRSDEYNELVKQFMKKSYNYPTSCAMALEKIKGNKIDLPNDILGLAYTKAIIENDYDINVHTIKRTNSYHSEELQEISSATSIRKALNENNDIKISVPSLTYQTISKCECVFTESYFEFIKYRINTSSIEDLSKIHLVTEGLENRIKSVINVVNDYEELVDSLTTKRYTRARISRVLMNVLVNFKKSDNLITEEEKYFRLLGMTKNGQKYLKQIKKRVDYITNIKNSSLYCIELELRVAELYKTINKKYVENFPVVNL